MTVGRDWARVVDRERRVGRPWKCQSAQDKVTVTSVAGGEGNFSRGQSQPTSAVFVNFVQCRTTGASGHTGTEAIGTHPAACADSKAAACCRGREDLVCALARQGDREDSHLKSWSDPLLLRIFFPPSPKLQSRRFISTDFPPSLPSQTLTCRAWSSPLHSLLFVQRRLRCQNVEGRRQGLGHAGKLNSRDLSTTLSPPTGLHLATCRMVQLGWNASVHGVCVHIAMLQRS